MSSEPPFTVVVTAGPTREYIDDVRYLSNASSGRMGIAVANAASAAGCRAHLLLGPVESPAVELVSPAVELHRFVSALDLDRLARELWPQTDAFVATAAVADYRPAERIPGKRKKDDGDWNLRLVRNPDVLAGRGAEKTRQVLVGFALEATFDSEAARRKLVQKQLDVIILNTAANLASAGGDFEWLGAGGECRRFHSVTKEELAHEIVEFVVARKQG